MPPRATPSDPTELHAEFTESRPTADVLLVLAAVVGCAAGGWDALGFFLSAPAWWPVPGYIGIAVCIALGCIAVLVDTLATPRPRRRPRRTALGMVALGVLVAAWVLRGHPEIPADSPIIVAQLVASAVLLILSLRRR